MSICFVHFVKFYKDAKKKIPSFFDFLYFLLEKPEKLNIKFRLAKEGEVAEGETESTTIQLVLEQSEAAVETDTEAMALTGDNQKTCTFPQKNPENSP